VSRVERPEEPVNENSSGGRNERDHHDDRACRPYWRSCVGAGPWRCDHTTVVCSPSERGLAITLTQRTIRPSRTSSFFFAGAEFRRRARLGPWYYGRHHSPLRLGSHHTRVTVDPIPRGRAEPSFFVLKSPSSSRRLSSRSRSIERIGSQSSRGFEYAHHPLSINSGPLSPRPRPKWRFGRRAVMHAVRSRALTRTQTRTRSSLARGSRAGLLMPRGS
jgi:hypothetical protein